MNSRWRINLLALMLSACLLPACSQAQPDPDLPNQEMPAHPSDGRLSTNWFAAVRRVLPSSYGANDKFDFQAATNGLARESRRGNLAAQALWGFALVALTNSPEATASGLKLMRGAAEKGFLPAMLNLGYVYEGGTVVPQNYDEAFHWFGKAAELGDAEGQAQLGSCYHTGHGTHQDYTMAAKYYRLSAEQTNYVAMKSLGFLLMNGYGMATNEDEAKTWLLKAATEGQNRRAMYDLGALCARKFPDTNAMIEGFKWMKKSADLGDALGANELSNFYLRGWGATETNLSNYRDWRSKAASLGATDAQYFMSQAYRTGDGVPTNWDKSLLWCRKAAAKNHPEALYDLALHHLDDKTNPASLKMANDLMIRAANMGHREAQFQCAMSCFRGDFGLDFKKGKEWLAKAAENGWPKAEFCLFQLYYKGSAPGKDCPAYPQDKTEALKWLRRAANHDSFQAQSTLAVMLIRGLDMEPDKVEAEKLLRNLAMHGFASAQNDLGFAILNGDITSTDPLEAAMWCKLAVAHATDPNVSKRAGVNLASASARLTADQQQEVDSRVRSFQPEPVPVEDPKITNWQANQEYQQEDGRFGH
jgi:TPR repeat protein